MNIKAVADLLGHSSIAITGDMYGHTNDDTARHSGRPGRSARAVKPDLSPDRRRLYLLPAQAVRRDFIAVNR